MTYTASKPPIAHDIATLRDSIPGWGVDRDPSDRPSVPREQFDPGMSGAHWEFPERQPESWSRERSIEHAILTPVFGTACPPKGLSGAIRRYAYRYSEGRAAHWTLLIAADRVDAVESHLRSFVSLRPDPVTETGIRSEVTHHGWKSRFRRGRADVKHQALDPVIVAGPWIAATAVAVTTVRRLRSRPDATSGSPKRSARQRSLPRRVTGG